jgi:hypothetical protein
MLVALSPHAFASESYDRTNPSPPSAPLPLLSKTSIRTMRDLRFLGKALADSRVHGRVCATYASGSPS